MIQERIDRYFVNPSWYVIFPDARVTHLTRCHSDHCPVLLEMQPRAQDKRIRPFHFHTSWLLDPSFFPIMHQALERNSRLVDDINCFNQEANERNKNQFGNIFSKKKNLMSRLDGIQRVLALRPSEFLVDLENELLKELDIMLK